MLKKYVVKTASGTVLGRVRNIIFETDGHTIVQYEVSPMGIGGALLIHRNQVVRFEEGEMIVEDTVAREIDRTESSAPLSRANPILMREE